MLTLTEPDFDRFRDLIRSASGIHFTRYNRSVLENRLDGALRKYALDSLDLLYRKLTTEKATLTEFIDSVTTNLTRFFRNEAQFEVLEQVILPELIRRKGAQKRLSIWSAGCSTGEEPYTIALSLLKVLPDARSWDLHIHASDISLRTLMVAKQGFYETSRVTHIPPDLLAKYFINLQDGYEVGPELKKLIRFDYHNLQHSTNLREMDIIFCRNVIIYFEESTQEKVVQSFYDTLGPKGYLFLGHSESLFSMKTRFQLYKSDKTTLYYKDEGSSSPVPMRENP